MRQLRELLLGSEGKRKEEHNKQGGWGVTGAHEQPSLQRQLAAFSREFWSVAGRLHGVTGVRFASPVKRSDFVPGESSIDLFVFGDKIPPESKRELITLLTVLNAKYKLGLERAPGQHPAPFFIDSRLSRLLYRLFKERSKFYWLARTVPTNGLFGAGYLKARRK